MLKLIVYNYCIENYTVFKLRNVNASKLVDIHEIHLNLMNSNFVNINIFIINIKNKIDEIMIKQKF